MYQELLTPDHEAISLDNPLYESVFEELKTGIKTANSNIESVKKAIQPLTKRSTTEDEIREIRKEKVLNQQTDLLNKIYDKVSTTEEKIVEPVKEEKEKKVEEKGFLDRGIDFIWNKLKPLVGDSVITAVSGLGIAGLIKKSVGEGLGSITSFLKFGKKAKQVKSMSLAKGGRLSSSKLLKKVPYLNMVMGAKDLYDIYENDNDAEVKESAGALIGQGIGAALGFFSPIPGGAAIGATIGDVAGEYIASLFEDPEDRIPNKIKQSAISQIKFIDSQMIPSERGDGLKDLIEYRNSLVPKIKNEIREMIDKSDSPTEEGKYAEVRRKIESLRSTPRLYAESLKSLNELSGKDTDLMKEFEPSGKLKSKFSTKRIFGEDKKEMSGLEKFSRRKIVDSVRSGLSKLRSGKSSLSKSFKPLASFAKEKLASLAGKRQRSFDRVDIADHKPTYKRSTKKSLGELPYSLGDLSAKFESGGGYGTISSGRGDRGGVSYGKYQLSSKGPLQQFLRETGYESEFSGMRVNSREFKSKWRELSKTREFKEAQERYGNEHYLGGILSKHPELGRSNTLKQVAFSLSVQHGVGGANSILRKAGVDSSMSDEEIIDRIYDERGRKTKSGKLAHFRSSSFRVNKSIEERFKKERAEALRMSREESSKPEVKKEVVVRNEQTDKIDTRVWDLRDKSVLAASMS